MNLNTISKRSFLAKSTAMLCCVTGGSTLAAAPGSKTGLKIGTYDSRAITIAAINSPGHKRQMDSVMSEYQTAKSAKDEKKMIWIRPGNQDG